MRKLLLLGVLGCLLIPGLAEAKHPHHHRRIKAAEMTQIGFGVAALLGAMGYAAFRRSRRSK